MTGSLRDRMAAIAAIGVLAVLAVVIGALVLDAQRAGIETREELRLEQVNQLAGSMDARVQQAYGSITAGVGAPGTFRMVPRDPADAERLAPTSAAATAGAVLLDHEGVVLNGSLLRDQASIGRPYDREGVDLALAGEPTILGVGPGLTTPSPVIGVAIPVRDAAGELAGVYVLESEVDAGSAFAQEVAQLGGEGSGSFSFVDSQGRVAASSDESRLGGRFGVRRDLLEPGFRRHDGQALAVDEVPSARWRLVFAQPLDDFEGDVTGPIRGALLVLVALVILAGAVSVITLVRRLRAAREEQRRLAEMSAAREEFTSIVSHELRTPVAGLLGFLQTTVDHWEEMTDGERLQAVQRAHQNARRLQGLTTEVLDASSSESGGLPLHLEALDLGELVADAVQTARDANPGRTFEVDGPDVPVPVVGDPARLRQVVTNLLDNAVKSSPHDAPVAVVVAFDGESARVVVRDHGSGIAPGDRERIFEKFTRGRVGPARGAGLGLYLAREILVAHGGTIRVVDVSGAGAAVAFTLPLGRDRGR